MLICTHIGVSPDGFVATPDGLPAWDSVPTFVPGESHGYPEFIEQRAVVMGRSSFDQGFGDWLTNWPDKRIYVLTSRQLSAKASAVDVVASQGGPAGLLEMLRDVQLLGGPRTTQAFLELGAITRLGMVILSAVLGKGIPLFSIEIATFSSEVLNGRNAHLMDGVRRALGREPKDFADYAHDAAATGIWDGGR